MNAERKKSQLIIVRHTPYGSSLARASLDAALAAAAFDQPVELLFLGDGVLQLLPAQDSTAIETRNISKLIASLPLYDVETLHVDASAIARYGITREELPQKTCLLDEAAMHQLIADHDHVLGF
jgi:tRNA 2-thiouridine synthesizing protein C